MDRWEVLPFLKKRSGKGFMARRKRKKKLSEGGMNAEEEKRGY